MSVPKSRRQESRFEAQHQPGDEGVYAKIGSVGNINLQEQIGNFLHYWNTTRNKNIK